MQLLIAAILSLGAQEEKRVDPIVLSLDYIARHQDEDGSWGAQPEECTCTHFPKAAPSEEEKVATTGLALLALLSAGYSDLSKGETLGGKNVGPLMAKGIGFLKKRQDDEGAVATQHPSEHLIGALALTELYDLTGHAPHKDAAARALKSVENTPLKKPEDSIWKGMVLKSAELGGLTRNIDQQLRDLSQRLNKEDSVTSHAGAVLLGKWIGETIESDRITKLFRVDVTTHSEQTVGLIMHATHEAAPGPKWLKWFFQVKKNLGELQVRQPGSHMRGSWKATSAENPVKVAVYRMLTLHHRRCFACGERNVFK